MTAQGEAMRPVEEREQASSFPVLLPSPSFVSFFSGFSIEAFLVEGFNKSVWNPDWGFCIFWKKNKHILFLR